jgi:hypothetical protein
MKRGFFCEGLPEIYSSGFRKSIREGALTKKQRAQIVNYIHALWFFELTNITLSLFSQPLLAPLQSREGQHRWFSHMQWTGQGVRADDSTAS